MRRSTPSSALAAAEPVARESAGGGRSATDPAEVVRIRSAIVDCPRAGVAGIHCPVMPRLAWDVAPMLSQGEPARAAELAVETARAGLACSAECGAAAPVADLAQAALTAAQTGPTAGT